MQTTSEARIAGLAARLLALVSAAAVKGSEPAQIERANELHAELALYPKLSVSMPHQGADVHLSLCLCDPRTDEVVVRLFEAEARAEVAPCN